MISKKHLASDLEKNIVVTGGGKGLGFSICQALLHDRHNVACVTRSMTPALAGLAKEFPETLSIFLFDLSQTEKIVELVRQLTRDRTIFGLVNCAGVGLDGVFLTQPVTDVQMMLNVNLLASMMLSRECAKRMILNRAGRIVNISSVSSEVSLSGLTTYGSTKAAMNQFTRGFAREVARRGISVNAVSPGYMATDMTKSINQNQQRAIQKRIPTGNFVTPAEVASVVLFLLFEAPYCVTGQIISVDGGFSL